MATGKLRVGIAGFHAIKPKLKMRKVIHFPRILKINWVRDMSVSVVFNNGESRIVDFKKVLEDLGLTGDSTVKALFDETEFEKVALNNNTLSWANTGQAISDKKGMKIFVPFEIGADTLLKYSKPEKPGSSSKVGQMIREARLKSGLSQKELALVSGTSRTYISRIENDRSDVEVATLRKIIETGLGKRLEISIK